jgi:hypothetical protein
MLAVHPPFPLFNFCWSSERRMHGTLSEHWLASMSQAAQYGDHRSTRFLECATPLSTRDSIQ